MFGLFNLYHFYLILKLSLYFFFFLGLVNLVAQGLRRYLVIQEIIIIVVKKKLLKVKLSYWCRCNVTHASKFTITWRKREKGKEKKSRRISLRSNEERFVVDPRDEEGRSKQRNASEELKNKLKWRRLARFLHSKCKKTTTWEWLPPSLLSHQAKQISS